MKLYSRLAAGHRFGILIRRFPFLYQSFRKLLAVSEEWDRSARKAWLNSRLDYTTEIASRCAGYQQNQAKDSFYNWPILKKNEVLGREATFGLSGWLPAYGASTGGTTGTPLSFKRSLSSVVMEQATIDHICRKAGLDLQDSRIAVLRGDYVKSPGDLAPPYWRSAHSHLQIFSSFHLSKATIHDYARELRRYSPDLLMCYPSSLQHLVALLEDAGEVIQIRCILSSSERLPPEVITRAQQFLHATVIDYYGQAERVGASYAINGGEHRIIPVYGFLEFLPDDAGRFEVIGTSLWNARQIFVRYRTGDFVLTSKQTEFEDIALGLEPFSGIEGRTTECIDLADGRRIIGLNHIPRGVPGVASVQLSQKEPSLIEAYVVPLNSYDERTEQMLITNFYAKFPEDISLRIVQVDTPVRSKLGKAPLLLPPTTS